MRKSQIALGKRLKQHFQACRFQTPLSGSRLWRSRAPPLITYITLAMTRRSKFTIKFVSFFHIHLSGGLN